MGDVLPSYGEATTRDHWSIISSFVRSQDLCSAALVSKEWNQLFMPHLWGNPASHFGKESDAVYVALVRFKRTLAWARSTTRELTHTLHLPPAQAELYDGPHAGWLQDILERLPRLQSLIVAQLPFFDHGALIALDIPRKNALSSMMYNIRLLDVSGCINTTPQGLEIALKHLPALVYLDISGTISARSHQVLSNLWRNPALQILKARGLGLVDNDIKILAHAVGTNLRSLDLRDNRLTDQAVRVILDKCIKPLGPSQQPYSPSTGTSTDDLRPRSGARLLEIYRSERQDDYIRASLTTGFINYLGLESTSGSGVTHLFISGNQITVEGVSGLVRSRKLHVLDAGNILTGARQIPATSANGEHSAHVVFPGAEKLTPILDSSVSDLTYLRISHSIVTKDAPSKKEIPELEDASTLLFPKDSVELEAMDQAVHELPANHVVELPGDSPAYAELEGSPVLRKQKAEQEPKQDAATLSPAEHSRPVANRTASSSAPEVVSPVSPTINASGGLFSPISPSNTLPSNNAIGNLFSPLSPSGTSSTETTITSASSFLTVPTNGKSRHKRTYSGVLSEHEAEIQTRKLHDHALLPSMLPKLQTLVLTDVPSKSTSKDVAEHLIQFITDCASEAHWAKLSSKVGYALPPSTDRGSSEKAYARTLFPLRRIVLEIAPEAPTTPGSGGWRLPQRRQQNMAQTYSSVQDADCETFWTAAKDDFSFFGGEECGLPDQEGIAPVPLAALMEKMVVGEPEAEVKVRRSSNFGVDGKAPVPMFDVLDQVSKFRKDKKAKFENAVRMGKGGIYVEGYWDGEIVVIRPRR
jgi:hypothetical protein